MNPIDAKLIEAWHDFKQYAQSHVGHTNTQNLNECLNGAGAFIDYLRGLQPKMGTTYATATLADRVSLLTDLDAFYTDHHRLCGELEAGSDDTVIWFECECGARIERTVETP
jgi:hypothetical protein